MIKHSIIDIDLLNEEINNFGIKDLGTASIREIVGLVNKLQQKTDVKFLRMEMGVPGLSPPEIGTNAEIEALKKGVASAYPMVDGVNELKIEASKFVKNFMNVNIGPEYCIPTSGIMQGSYATFLLCSNIDSKKDTALFIDPGFPVQKQQFAVMGHKYESFDVFNYRGEALREKLESYLSKSNINSIIYSNPNNPSWICFTENELQIIGELANKYDVIVIEDLAYFAMDFRKNLYSPGKPPYQVSVANYTDNYVLLMSGSKIFSYAGQRIGIAAISEKLFNREYSNLKKRFNCNKFGYTFVLRIIYSLSSGVSHSAQYALAAMFKAANDNKFNFIEAVKEYEKRAKIMKKIFLEAGFKIVYDKDIDMKLADGFYFTISYPGLSGGELLKNLLLNGISAITLLNTGSSRSEGLRACVSQISLQEMSILKDRLNNFISNLNPNEKN